MADPGRPGVDDGVRRRSGVGIGRKVRLDLRSDPDPRAVMTLGDVDQDAVASAVGFVVASQLRPKLRGLDPDRRIDARIERLGLVEDPHTDDVLFEVGCAACRRLLDDEAQEAGHARRVGEPGARDDSFQRFLDRHGLQHVSAPRSRPVFSLRRPRSSHSPVPLLAPCERHTAPGRDTSQSETAPVRSGGPLGRASPAGLKPRTTCSFLGAGRLAALGASPYL